MITSDTNVLKCYFTYCIDEIDYTSFAILLSLLYYDKKYFVFHILLLPLANWD